MALIAAALVVAFASMFGLAALPPSDPRMPTFTVAMWTIRSPNDCCGGVGLEEYLSSGISAAILSIVAFRSAQSFSISALREGVCAFTGCIVAINANRETVPSSRSAFTDDLLN